MDSIIVSTSAGGFVLHGKNLCIAQLEETRRLINNPVNKYKDNLDVACLRMDLANVHVTLTSYTEGLI